MSCSTTTTVRSSAMRCSSSPVSSRLLGAHPGDRLVEQQQLGVLHQQHADLEPLLLAVRAACRPGCRRGRSGRSSPAPRPPRRARPAGGAAASARRGRRRPRCRGSAARVSSSNTVAVWKVRPTPSRAIWCTFWPSSSTPAEAGRPGGLHQPGDGVDQRRLARAVRADEEPQVALEHRQVDAVDGVEAVEGDRQAADLEVVGRHAVAAGRRSVLGARIGRPVERADPASGRLGVAAGRGGAPGARHVSAAQRRPGRRAGTPTTTMNSRPWT